MIGGNAYYLVFLPDRVVKIQDPKPAWGQVYTGFDLSWGEEPVERIGAGVRRDAAAVRVAADGVEYRFYSSGDGPVAEVRSCNRLSVNSGKVVSGTANVQLEGKLSTVAYFAVARYAYPPPAPAEEPAPKKKQELSPQIASSGRKISKRTNRRKNSVH